MRRPWRAEEFPSIAGWLAVNQKPLDLLAEASKRPYWFSPLVSDGGLMCASSPIAMKLREGIRALSARAMQRLQDGNVNGAWSDLLAVHRFARLASCGPTLIDRLVAVATDGIACATDRRCCNMPNSRPIGPQKMRADLDALPPMAKMIDALDAGSGSPLSIP